MRFLSKLLGRIQSSQTPEEPCFPLFLFSCGAFSEKHITRYGSYVKTEVKNRLKVFDRSVANDPNWRGYFGDLLYPEVMPKLLRTSALCADLSLLDPGVASKLKSGNPLGFIAFMAGVGNFPRGIISRIHNQINNDAVVGYLGSILFAPLAHEDAIALSRTLALMREGWWNS
jgi:hypothetical protein